MKRILCVFVLLLTSTWLIGQTAGKKAEQKSGDKAVSNTAGSVEQTLLDMERKWVAASLKNDAAALDAILAPEWTTTSVEGKVVSRAETLDELKKSKWTRQEVSDMKVRMITPDVAVVTGAWMGVGIDGKGQKVDTSEHWTDVFAKIGGNWKCVISHNTTVKK